jgi:hypothetical protein
MGTSSGILLSIVLGVIFIKNQGGTAMSRVEEHWNDDHQTNSSARERQQRIPRSGLLKGAAAAVAALFGAGMAGGIGARRADAAVTAASNFAAYGTDTTFTGSSSVGFDASDSRAGFSTGVQGTGDTAGVVGVVGKLGSPTLAAGILGLGMSGKLLGGIPYKAGTGVFALAGKGSVGVDAYGSGGIGVHGTTRSDSNAGILGQNNAAGPGIHGLSKSGRGGVFEGKLAAVHLTPSSLPSHPRGGQPGDLMVDASHRLWFCRRGGNPAQWKQLA